MENLEDMEDNYWKSPFVDNSDTEDTEDMEDNYWKSPFVHDSDKQFVALVFGQILHSKFDQSFKVCIRF
jgi:hypothetical protein